MRGACKPDFVPRIAPVRRPFIWTANRFAASSCQPGSLGRSALPGLSDADTGSLFGVAPGGACHARDVAVPPVRFDRTVSPLPRFRRRRTSGSAGAVCSLWRCPSALAVRALPGTVASWSPDFPPREAVKRTLSAAVRPPARHGTYGDGRCASMKLEASPGGVGASGGGILARGRV